MLGAVRCELLVGHEWPVRIAGRNASSITRVMGNILSSIGTSRDGARPVMNGSSNYLGGGGHDPPAVCH